MLATAAEKESLAAKSQYQTSHSRSLREFDKMKNESVNLAKLQQDVQYQMDDAEALSAQANQVIGEHNALEREISSLENDICQLKSELSTRNTNIHHHRQRLHNLESEKNRLHCQLDAEHSKNNSLESEVRSLQSKLNSRATSSNSHSPRMPKAHVTHQKKRVACTTQTNRLNISKAKLDSFRSKNITLRH
ncbi:hypothetical protein BSZ32_15425 [Rubritalea profundi]|uniref:Uncharacterized protein n=1 Tax=Rubritalea profundi TaxID=1658618 RepID=A0A2S7U5F1_9BACT|nr:hypothetical protein BSZ32_15425 [Rubritalea profundi]